jgi:hypothetical protein
LPIKSDALKPLVNFEISASPHGVLSAFGSSKLKRHIAVTAALSLSSVANSSAFIPSISTLVNSPTGFTSFVLMLISLF